MRLRQKFASLELEASVSRLNIVDRDLLRSGETGLGQRERINNYILAGAYGITEALPVGGYAILRDDTTDPRGNPIFLGLRSAGFLTDDFGYWADLAHVRGGEVGLDIRGYGVDIGATYGLNLPLNPYITLAYAWGSGDGNPADGKEGVPANRSSREREPLRRVEERQVGSLADLKYYGEVFDPELSNIRVFTAGIGIRPSENLSIDVVYHHYRQDVVAGTLHDAAVELNPNLDPARQSKQLGNEVDLILGFRAREDLGFLLALGYFMPGSAYRLERSAGEFVDADDAFAIRFEVEYEF